MKQGSKLNTESEVTSQSRQHSTYRKFSVNISENRNFLKIGIKNSQNLPNSDKSDLWKKNCDFSLEIS